MSPLRPMLAAAALLTSCMCGTREPAAPQVHAVVPAEVVAGYAGALGVAGAHFAPRVHADFDRPDASTVETAGFRARLVGAEGALELADVRWVSEAALEARVPVALAAGAYTLELVDPRGLTTSLPGALVVRPAQVEPACVESADCTLPPGVCLVAAGCEEGRCVWAPAAAGTPCEDALACSASSACDGAGQCVEQARVSCSGPAGAHPACWSAACSEASGGACELSLMDPAATCDDGQLCTLGDHCDGAGGCTGTPRACPDAPATGQPSCWVLPGRCSEAGGGRCEFDAQPARVACDDGKVCTTGEQCDGEGGCGAGLPVACPPPPPTGCYAPEVPCVEEALGCVPQVLLGAPCDDGNACTGGDACGADGLCRPGTTPAVGAGCDDGNGCTVEDACDGSGACVPGTPVAAGGPCDDGNVCTAEDACDGSGACAPGTPVEGACDDGDACTRDDACSGGGCAGTFDPSLPGCSLPPRACLVVRPAVGHPQGDPAGATRFVADASCSSAEAGTLEYRFDWEGDGVWDTPYQASALAVHVYPTAPAGTPVVRVRVDVRAVGRDGRLRSQAERRLAVAPSARTLVVTSPSLDERDSAAPGFSLAAPLGTGLSLPEAIDAVNGSGLEGWVIGFAPSLTLLSGGALNDADPAALPPRPNSLALVRPGTALVGHAGLTLDFAGSAEGQACLEVDAPGAALVGLALTGCGGSLLRLGGASARVAECSFSPGPRDGPAPGVEVRPPAPVLVGPGNAFSGFGAGGAPALRVDATGCRVEGNRFHGNRGEAVIDFSNHQDDGLVRANLFHDNGAPGGDSSVILLRNHVSGTTIVHNTFHGNAGHGVHVFHNGTFPTRVSNNLFSAQGRTALDGDAGDFATPDGREPNGYFTTGSAFRAGTGTPDGARSVVDQDPLFADPAHPVPGQRDFRLRATSPMNERAADLGALPADPDGPRRDLGALESPF